MFHGACNSNVSNEWLYVVLPSMGKIEYIKVENTTEPLHDSKELTHMLLIK